MDNFAPPSGPPPPKVPEGWKAVWNDQYKEWFYVNLHTKQSQWDKPEAPAFDPNASQQSDAPPTYTPGQNAPVNTGTDTKAADFQSNNPYHQNIAESDEAMARRLQEEENSRRSADQSRGASDSYYGGQNQGYPSSPSYGYPNAPDYNNPQSQQQQQQSSLRPPADRGSKSGSFLSKIKDKMNNPQQRPMGQPMMGYGAGGYPPPGQYGGYPQQRYAQQGYPQQGYGRPMGGMPMGGMGYGQPGKKPGMSAGKAAALGVGGGLLGGALLANGIDDMEDNAYDQGFDDGADFDGGDMGGDF